MPRLQNRGTPGNKAEIASKAPRPTAGSRARVARRAGNLIVKRAARNDGKKIWGKKDKPVLSLIPKS